MVKERIDPVAVRTAEARRDWAIKRSRALAKRRLELEGGALPVTGTGFDDAVARYFEDHPTIRDATRDVYRAAADKLKAWAARQGIRKADDLTGHRLAAFRAELVKEKKTIRKTGGKRGQRAKTEIARSPHSVNRELRSVRTILGYLRKLGLLPRLSGDGLTDALERLRVPSEALDYLRPADLQRLMEAALRHDAATYDATRAELSGRGRRGSTPRYEQIAPFVAFVLLSGVRFAEALDLTWDRVDLDALDHDGRKVGEIRLTAADTKTAHARTIGLEVSPAIRALLAALKLRSGGEGSVFALTEGTANAAALRLRRDYGAPKGSNWQALRQSCGSYLTNAPGIFGAASAYRSAKQLGHSVTVAEKHYVGLVRGIPLDARTLEDAMQIRPQLERVTATIGARPATRKTG